ncbi:MAG: DinB family protein [Acidimicrobiales bacterium]
MTTCQGCGFVLEDLPTAGIGDGLRGVIPRFRQILASGPDRRLRERPDLATWSPLEYACHVRDVLFIQRDRVLRALVENRPDFAPMHREERVALARYASEAPPLVGEEIAIGAGLLARLVDGLSTEQMGRRCVYGYPDKTEVDVAWVGRHTVHEAEHHLLDMRRILGRGA